MKVFRFRLEKVLDYRQSMEQWAQDAYLETRVARLEGDAALERIGERRVELLRQCGLTLDARRQTELLLETLDDEERAQRSVLSVLVAEEEKALDLWHEKRRELETMVKLRDRAYEEWQLESTRQEQAELDEWAVMRRGT